MANWPAKPERPPGVNHASNPTSGRLLTKCFREWNVANMQTINGLHIPQSLGEIVTPTNTALIVYDMQVGIVRQIPRGQEIT